MTRDEAQALLAEYALEVLSEAERTEVERWLDDDPGLRRALSEIRDGLTGLADALTPVSPSAAARARLLEAAAGPDRFSAVFNEVARYCDLAVDQVRQVMRQLEDATRWEPGPMPGIQIQHFDHGPAAAGADTGFVRYPPNFSFPPHRHVGTEVTIVLEGSFTDHDGRTYRPGDTLVYEGATEHRFEVGPDGLTIVICFSGFELA